MSHEIKPTPNNPDERLITVQELLASIATEEASKAGLADPVSHGIGGPSLETRQEYAERMDREAEAQGEAPYFD